MAAPEGCATSRQDETPVPSHAPKKEGISKWTMKL